MHRLGKEIFLFALGGGIYSLLELIYKSILLNYGTTHWSMFVVGGIIFLVIGAVNEVIPWEMPLIVQGIIGGVLITAMELPVGLYLNDYLGIGVWDYSDLPLDLCGQICLPFSLIWVLIATAAVLLDDWLGYWLFGKERPHYKVL